MTDDARYRAETLFLDLADWAEEQRARMAPDARTPCPVGTWLGRMDQRPAAPWVHLWITPASEFLWAELQRKPQTFWRSLQELYRVWRELDLAKTGVVEIGGKSHKCISLSVLQVARLRYERTT